MGNSTGDSTLLSHDFCDVVMGEDIIGPLHWRVDRK